MNADSLSKGLERAQQERQQAQAQEALKLLETFKSDFQNSLLAESQNFKNSIAETKRKLKWLTITALIVTALAVLSSSVLTLVSISAARRMSQQAETLRRQMEIADPYAELRQQKLIPVGQPITIQNNRIAIELKRTE